ncbi:MAG: hypothetical protein OHK0015_10930 [Chloroflexi bacterium OHK40]
MLGSRPRGNDTLTGAGGGGAPRVLGSRLRGNDTLTGAGGGGGRRVCSVPACAGTTPPRAQGAGGAGTRGGPTCRIGRHPVLRPPSSAPLSREATLGSGYMRPRSIPYQ